MLLGMLSLVHAGIKVKPLVKGETIPFLFILLYTWCEQYSVYDMNNDILEDKAW